MLNCTIDQLFNQISFLRGNHCSPPPTSDSSVNLSELIKNLTLQGESLDSTISVENDSVSSYNTEINQSINKRYGTIAEQLASVRMN